MQSLECSIGRIILSNRVFFIVFCLILSLNSSLISQESQKIQFSDSRINGKTEIIAKGFNEKPSDQVKAETPLVKENPDVVLDEKCGTMYVDEMMGYERPSVEEFEHWMEEMIQAHGETQNAGVVITIPVVVHVIHNGQSVGGLPNISNEQVLSQIEVLNEDFRRMNPDATNTPADFLSVAADAEIEFCLATVDPDGNETNGINRFNGGQPTYSIGNMQSIKAQTIWHPDFYFNIWCAPLQGSLLGYAQFPSMSGLPGFDPNEGIALTDGIVVRDWAFGRGGSSMPPFDLGRTATHEAGHFFGLRHNGGDGDCTVDDFCDDTPTQDGQNNNFVTDCSYPADNDCDDGTGDLPDMFMNFMDYSDDGCKNIFTQHQKARFDAVLSVSPRRASLLNSMVCNGEQPDYVFNPYPNAPMNDTCLGAIVINCDQVIMGSTADASPVNQPGTCGVTPQAVGVWYKFTGNGNNARIELCGSNFDTQLNVYSGSCGSLVCVGGNDDLCGKQYTGSTHDATTTGEPQDCRTTVTAPGIWYSFVGNGDIVFLSTCNNASYNTKINVYSGNCGNFVCVASKNDGPGCVGVGSMLNFASDVGTTYYIYVNGFTNETGLFILSVDCITPPANDLCADAIMVACGEDVSGNTDYSSAIGAPAIDCFDEPFSDDVGQGVWYKFIGTGEDILLSTCNAANFDTKIDVFTGGCDNLSCVAGNDDGGQCVGRTSAFEFPSVLGVEYYIYVSGFTINGFKTSTGDFTLSICNANCPLDVFLDPNWPAPTEADCNPDGTYFLSIGVDNITFGGLPRNLDGTIDLTSMVVNINGQEIPWFNGGFDDVTLPYPYLYLETFTPGDGLDAHVTVTIGDCFIEDEALFSAPDCDCYSGVGPNISICSGYKVPLMATTNGTGGYWSIDQGDGMITDVNNVISTYLPGPEDLEGQVILSWTQPAFDDCVEVTDQLIITFTNCIPTLSEWSILILSLIVIIMGVVGIRVFVYNNERKVNNI